MERNSKGQFVSGPRSRIPLVERVCKYCKKSFLTDKWRVDKGEGNYCNKICRAKAPKRVWQKGLYGDPKVMEILQRVRKNRKPYPRPCRLCNKSFNSLSPTKIICEKCSIRNCLFCQKEYIGETTRSSKYCSRKCRYKDFGEKMVARYPDRALGKRVKRFIRIGRRYQIWRKEVLERDNHRCIQCGSKEKLNIDHYPLSLSEILSQYNIRTVKQVYGCGILWSIDNGRTLCEECHKKTLTYGQSYWRYITMNT